MRAAGTAGKPNKPVLMQQKATEDSDSLAACAAQRERRSARTSSSDLR
jgi:hypothetical protein